MLVAFVGQDCPRYAVWMQQLQVRRGFELPVIQVSQSAVKQWRGRLCIPSSVWMKARKALPASTQIGNAAHCTLGLDEARLLELAQGLRKTRKEA